MTETTTSGSDKSATKKAGKKAKKSQSKAGRPSLDKGGKSPQIAFRVAGPTRKRAKEVAEKEGTTVSKLSRKALKEYLEKH